MPYIGRSLGDGVRARYIYAATSGQTTFSGNDANGIALAYSDTLYMDVYQNGVLLKPVTDYASTTGTSVVLVTGASTDDVVEMIVYDSFAVADTVSAANGGTFSGNMSMGGTLGVTGAATLSSTLAVTDDLTVDSGTLFVDASANRVGIGTTSPSQLLSIVDSGSARIEIKSGTTGTSIIDMGDTDDADIGGIRYSHADNEMTFRANNDVRMTIDSSGGVGIGVTSIDKALIAYENSGAGGYCFEFINDGNNANRYGGIVQCGTDDASGTNYLFVFRDGDGTSQGYITFSGGTVTYGAFTAHHPCILPDADNDAGYAYGTLLETTSISYTQKNGADTERGILYNVQKTQGANSRAVLGAYGGSMVNGPDEETNMHQALVLGDGHILCNNAGGNIEVGDGICSSSTAGIGQKATANPSMIIGIAQEAVTFASGSKTKLVPVQYGLQQFIPWS